MPLTCFKEKTFCVLSKPYCGVSVANAAVYILRTLLVLGGELSYLALREFSLAHTWLPPFREADLHVLVNIAALGVL